MEGQCARPSPKALADTREIRPPGLKQMWAGGIRRVEFHLDRICMRKDSGLWWRLGDPPSGIEASVSAKPEGRSPAMSLPNGSRATASA